MNWIAEIDSNFGKFISKYDVKLMDLLVWR